MSVTHEVDTKLQDITRKRL